MTTATMENYVEIYDKRIPKQKNPAITIDNKCGDFGSEYAHFELEADIGWTIENIEKNYQSPDSEDLPCMLSGDLFVYLEEWFKENVADKIYHCVQYYLGDIEVYGPSLDSEKMNKLSSDLNNWLDNCYNYAW